MTNNAEDRKKRVEKNRDQDALITEKNGGNVYEEHIFDVLEYIEKEAVIGNNSVARKILKLKEYGITDGQIVQYYKDNSDPKENENRALSVLESVFEKLVNYINDIPNGVYINLATAEKTMKRVSNKRLYMEYFLKILL